MWGLTDVWEETVAMDHGSPNVVRHVKSTLGEGLRSDKQEKGEPSQPQSSFKASSTP